MRILVATDGRAGILNPALGLAEAAAALVLERDEAVQLHVHDIENGSAFAALPPALQLAGRRDFGLPDGFDLVIGCGRQAVAPLLGLKRAGSPAFTVFLGDPRVDPDRFDLVIAPGGAKGYEILEIGYA